MSFELADRVRPRELLGTPFATPSSRSLFCWIRSHDKHRPPMRVQGTTSTEKKLRHSCFGVAYILTMMTDLYDVSVPDGPLSSVSRVVLANEIKGGMDASWVLGAAYTEMNRIRFDM